MTIPATSTAYDWGKSEFVASFGRNGSSGGGGGGSGGGGNAGGSGGSGSGPGSGPNPGTTDGSGSTSPGVELRGIIKDGKITQGTLIGSHFGKRSFVLERDGANLFDSTTEQVYDVVWKSVGKAPDIRSVLKIKTLTVTQPAPKISDLPVLPGLEVSLEFDSFAMAPQNASAALYDPTTATLDIQFI